MSNLGPLPDPLVDTEPAFTANGTVRHFGQVPAHTTALEWLRANGLTGAKEGCAEGECGACAILVAQTDRAGGARWAALTSCLIPMAALDGAELVTAEGLGTPEKLHPVQAAMAAAGGSQCGYCTPGFVCSMAAEFYRLDRQPPPDATSPGESEGAHPETGPNGFDLHALSGNLCRCTGYRPIRDAAFSLPMADDDPFSRRRLTSAPEFRPTFLERDDGIFIRATTLPQAVALLAENPGAVLLAGSTDWGVEVTIRARRAPLVIAIESIPELNVIHSDDTEIEIGAAVPLSEIAAVLGDRVPLLAQLIPQFASRLIRNRATLGGNLGTGSPIGDSPPALLALEAQIVLVSAMGERVLPLAEYFTGYRATLKRADELIKSVRIPLPYSNVTAFHKIAKRRFDDISSVAVAFSLHLDGGIITSAKIGLGGVAAIPLRAHATESLLTGQPWNRETIRHASATLEREGTPMDDHRAGSRYRSLMLSGALMKLYAQNSAAPEVSS
ncbi:FAD binding domain-containing protein [Specibacter sp. NPDC078709]|uniref:xanthine dehydrogenase small subunit n=1 Tax=Specibacter sp. NPDC078709 TaxID=3154364 RepID=UPI00341C92D0